MKKKWKILVASGAIFCAVGGTVPRAQTAPYDEAGPPYSKPESDQADRTGSLGWLGLIGLMGLLGRRRQVAATYRTRRPLPLGSY